MKSREASGSPLLPRNVLVKKMWGFGLFRLDQWFCDENALASAVGITVEDWRRACKDLFNPIPGIDEKIYAYVYEGQRYNEPVMQTNTTTDAKMDNLAVQLHFDKLRLKRLQAETERMRLGMGPKTRFLRMQWAGEILEKFRLAGYENMYVFANAVQAVFPSASGYELFNLWEGLHYDLDTINWAIAAFDILKPDHGSTIN